MAIKDFVASVQSTKVYDKVTGSPAKNTVTLKKGPLVIVSQRLGNNHWKSTVSMGQLNLSCKARPTLKQSVNQAVESYRKFINQQLDTMTL